MYVWTCQGYEIRQVFLRRQYSTLDKILHDDKCKISYFGMADFINNYQLWCRLIIFIEIIFH